MIRINTSGSDFPVSHAKKGDVHNFEFFDPAKDGATYNRYCVGFSYEDGPLADPKSWDFHHCNFWDGDNETDELHDPKDIPKEELETLLAEHGGSTVESLLSEHFNSLSENHEGASQEVKHLAKHRR